MERWGEKLYLKQWEIIKHDAVRNSSINDSLGQKFHFTN